MYAELRCKTNFSFLTGASHPHELIETAAKLRLKAIAITDYDGVYGIPKAYWEKKQHPQLKLITGADLNLEGQGRLTLLAQDRQAYGLMCRLLTESHRDHEKGKAALDFSLFLKMMEEPAGKGLIALRHFALDEREETFYGSFKEIKEIFEDRFFITLTRYLDGRDSERTEKALEISHKWAAPLVASNDVHYHASGRHKLQHILTAIKEETTLEKSGFKLFSNNERYLKSFEQMKSLYQDMSELLTRTEEIAERCTFSPKELRYTYPSEWIPPGYTSQKYLEELTYQGAKGRYLDGIGEKVGAQLKYELDLIGELGFADYFLTIYEIVDFARGKKILCQGRGSAANSIVCYCLGITAIDPVKMELLFERFISRERGEPPDIDVDFEHERREEVIQHIYEKYGRHRAAMVSAVVTYQHKMAFREISKSLGVDVGTLSAKKVIRNFDELAKTANIPNCFELVETLAEDMQGFPRHLSIHSGGFTLSAHPITETVPIEPARMKDRTIVQWDKYDLDYLGLLKVDVLSLGTLSALRKTMEAVGYELHTIPPDDAQTYKMIQRAETVGTFQIESRAQMGMLGRLLPENFYDLVIEVAIVRPGPIIGNMIHPYLKRRRKLELPNYYNNEKLEKILSRTLGVPIFQEQVMKIAIDLANFTPGESDELRRAIGAWRSSGKLVALRQRLMDGLIANGLPREFAEILFEQIKGFSHYGFPESHAASFALLAYASSFLKCHHPAEFACALVNSQPLGFYSNHTILDEAKLNGGVTLLPLNPLISEWDLKIEAVKTIRMGWRVVAGIDEKAARLVVSENLRQPFTSLKDFLSRTTLSQGVLHKLAMGNTFECFGLDQRHSLWQILEYQFNQQLLLGRQDLEAPQLLFNELTKFEAVSEDFNAFGLSTQGHLMSALRKVIKLPSLTASQVRQLPTGTKVYTSGLLIVRQRPPTAKGTVFATLEDETGLLDLILHKDTHAKYRDLFDFHAFLLVEGILQRDHLTVNVLVQTIAVVNRHLDEVRVPEAHNYH